LAEGIWGAADVFERRLTLSSHPFGSVSLRPDSTASVGEAEIYRLLRGRDSFGKPALDKRANWWLWVLRGSPGIGEQQAWRA
jgi:hypothetical protein